METPTQKFRRLHPERAAVQNRKAQAAWRARLAKARKIGDLEEITEEDQT